MADDDKPRIPTIIKASNKDALRKALSSMSDEEIDRVHAAVEHGTPIVHAVNVIHSQRAQDAARASVDDAQATPFETAAVTAGNAATAGGIPTIAAALGHGEGDTFAARKASNVADAATMTAQNPGAASLGEAAGLALPALGGSAAGAIGGAGAATTQAPSLLRLAAEGAKGGAALGAPLGALQTDTGTPGSIAANALGGAAGGALTGAAGAGATGGALRLMPSLADTTVSEAAAAPGLTLRQLGGEALDNGEDALVHGSSAALRLLAQGAPLAGSAVGASAGGALGSVVGPGTSMAGAMGGKAIGGNVGLRLRGALNDAALAPYTGGSMPVPSTPEQMAAGLVGMPSNDGALVTPPTPTSEPLPPSKPLSGSTSSPIPEITRAVASPVPDAENWSLNAAQLRGNTPFPGQSEVPYRTPTDAPQPPLTLTPPEGAPMQSAPGDAGTSAGRIRLRPASPAPNDAETRPLNLMEMREQQALAAQNPDALKLIPQGGYLHPELFQGGQGQQPPGLEAAVRRLPLAPAAAPHAPMGDAEIKAAVADGVRRGVPLKELAAALHLNQGDINAYYKAAQLGFLHAPGAP